MRLLAYIKKIRNYSIFEACLIISERIYKCIKDSLLYTYDRIIPGNNFPIINRVNHINFEFDFINICMGKYLEVFDYTRKKYLSHKFNLLGSGWKKVNYKDNLYIDIDGLWLKKVVNNSNLKKSQQIWSYLVEKNAKLYDYIPINWQRDFRNDYCFSCKVWYKKIKVKHNVGYDIKVPWELSRLQHLPQIAIMAHYYEGERVRLLAELKNQCLDFILSNPVRWGVNWVCTMDVGIRISNMIMAYWIAKQIDTEEVFDQKFEQILSRSVYEHANHIYNNLEKSKHFKGNHYLANIAGLLFASSFLERNHKTVKWMTFSINELFTCIDEQFNNDGSNFEASTAYHCLSSEMVIYSFALILGLQSTGSIKNIFGNKDCNYTKFLSDKLYRKHIITKIYNMGRFIKDISKPDGDITLVGDNDSGRFFKFTLDGFFIEGNNVSKIYLNLKDYKDDDNYYFDENNKCYQNIIAAFGAVFNDGLLSATCEKYPIETDIILKLKKGFEIYKHEYDFEKSDNFHLYSEVKKEDINLGFVQISQILFDNIVDLNSIRFSAYPDFGIYIFKNKEFYLSISATNNGQNGLGGHAHNDKLSFELTNGGVDYQIDPGCYVYTPDVSYRNLFRSVQYHNTVIINGEEQNSFTDEQLFRMINETCCEIIDFGSHYIELLCKYRDIFHVRRFEIKPDRLIIIDKCNHEFKLLLEREQLISNGYGKLITFMQKAKKESLGGNANEG